MPKALRLYQRMLRLVRDVTYDPSQAERL